ncbi:MAG: HAD hydrolase-like protein, partial [Planctomycetota bacterium]|nr:HAD hydrolase-like protein [Planctomycetota bacterium]
RFHQALDEQLELLGARLDAYYSCPHLPDPLAATRADLAVECDCRKPKPGLLLQAAQDLDIDLAASWTVGDKWRDIACGQTAGTRTIKLPPPPSSSDVRPPDAAPPTAEAADLDQAAMFILAHPERRPAPVAPHEAPAPAAEPQAVAAPPPPTTEPPAAAPSAEEEAAEPPETPAFVISQSLAEPAEEESPPPPAAPPESPAAPVEAAAPALPHAPARERRKDSAAPQRPAAAPSADVSATLLRELLGELRRLDRARHPSSLSLQRLLAYMLQAGAGACLVFGLVSAERMTFLLLTCILLLVALTLIVLERRS